MTVDCKFNDLPTCIIQYIADNYLKTLDTIALSQINKKCHKIKIKDFVHINEKFKEKLTPNILMNYCHLERLDIRLSKVIDVTYLTKLKILYVNQYNYTNLQHFAELEELYIDNYSCKYLRETQLDVNPMAQLKVLSVINVIIYFHRKFIYL